MPRQSTGSGRDAGAALDCEGLPADCSAVARAAPHPVFDFSFWFCSSVRFGSVRFGSVCLFGWCSFPRVRFRGGEERSWLLKRKGKKGNESEQGGFARARSEEDEERRSPLSAPFSCLEASKLRSSFYNALCSNRREGEGSRRRQSAPHGERGVSSTMMISERVADSVAS